MLRLILVLAASVAAQVYENPALHGRYEVPAGWAMETPTNTPFGVQWNSTRVGLQPVHMQFMKWVTPLEAVSHRTAFCFWNLNYFYHSTSASTQAPLVPEIMDTLVVSGTSYAFIVAKHIELNRILVCWASANQSYVQTFRYQTTIADYETNYALYFQNWARMSYYTGPVAAKPSASFSAQERERQGLLDVLGRRLSTAKANRTPRFYPLR